MLIITAAPAAAQSGEPYPPPAPPPPPSEQPTEPPSDQLNEDLDRDGEADDVGARTDAVGSGRLPFTGSDLGLLVVIGLLLAIAGFGLTRSRQRRPA